MFVLLVLGEGTSFSKIIQLRQGLVNWLSTIQLMSFVFIPFIDVTFEVPLIDLVCLSRQEEFFYSIVVHWYRNLCLGHFVTKSVHRGTISFHRLLDIGCVASVGVSADR